MSEWSWRRLACPLSLALLLPLGPAGAQGASGACPELPLVFVENRGQLPSETLFEARVPGLRAGFSATGFTLTAGGEAEPTRTSFHFLGARRGTKVVGVTPLAGRVNHLVGPREDWVVGARTFQGLRYEGLLAGIDLEVRVQDGRIEYDLLLQPGARAEDVVVRCSRSDIDHGEEGEELRVSDDGSLVTSGAVVQRAPRSWQVTPDGTRRDVPSSFRLLGHGCFSFAVGEHDATLPLVIDPVLVYTRYVGGSNADEAWGVAVDSAGALYAAGASRSSDFPVTGAALDAERDGRDGVVFKLDPTGTTLEYATYFGGKGEDRALALRVSPAGEAFLTGETRSDDFPVTSGAHTSSRVGGADAFVLVLDAEGKTLRFSTFLGGAGDDAGNGLVLDRGENVLVVGTTRSIDFPVTSRAVQTTRGGGRDAFLVKLDASGSVLHYATYLGGMHDEEGRAVTVDSAGRAYVAGRTGSADFPVTAGAFDVTRNDADAFVCKLSADGGALHFSTFLGGSLQDEATAIAHAPDDSVLVAGWTRSPDFPVRGAGAQVTLGGRRDGFIVRFPTAGGALLQSTFLGGTGTDECNAIDIDSSGHVWVAGSTDSDDFPVTDDAPQLMRGGGTDGFVVRFDGPEGSVGWASYLGRGGDEVLHALHVNPFSGAVAVAGDADHVSPLVRGEFGGRTSATDAVVTRIAPGNCGTEGTVEVLGGGAGASLSTTLPRLGRDFVLTLEGASPEADGVLLLGHATDEPVPLEGLGWWHLERGSAFPLCSFETDATGSFTVTVPLPPVAALCGRQLTLQGFVVAPEDGPLVFGQVTDALRFTLGD